MEPVWTDTDSATEREMMRLLRSASPAKRFGLADALTSSVIGLSRRALRKKRPRAPEQEIMLEWVGLHYGPELERELREFLAADGS